MLYGCVPVDISYGKRSVSRYISAGEILFLDNTRVMHDLCSYVSKSSLETDRHRIFKSVR